MVVLLLPPHSTFSSYAAVLASVPDFASVDVEMSVLKRTIENWSRYLQRSLRHPGLLVRRGSRLALLSRVHDPHNVGSKIRVDVIKPGREALHRFLEPTIPAYVVLHVASERLPEIRVLDVGPTVAPVCSSAMC